MSFGGQNSKKNAKRIVSAQSPTGVWLVSMEGASRRTVGRFRAVSGGFTLTIRSGNITTSENGLSGEHGTFTPCVHSNAHS